MNNPRRNKAEKQSEFKGVHWQRNTLKGANQPSGWWRATIIRDNVRLVNSLFNADEPTSERRAAIAVDKALLDAGLEPINVLKRK